MAAIFRPDPAALCDWSLILTKVSTCSRVPSCSDGVSGRLMSFSFHRALEAEKVI